MKQVLQEYINKLKKELNLCVEIDNELTENRSDNYYYNTRVELLNEIIFDLENIINKERNDIKWKILVLKH